MITLLARVKKQISNAQPHFPTAAAVAAPAAAAAAAVAQPNSRSTAQQPQQPQQPQLSQSAAAAEITSAPVYELVDHWDDDVSVTDMSGDPTEDLHWSDDRL